mgnify:CR=1 FL=1
MELLSVRKEFDDLQLELIKFKLQKLGLEFVPAPIFYPLRASHSRVIIQMESRSKTEKKENRRLAYG